MQLPVTATDGGGADPLLWEQDAARQNGEWVIRHSGKVRLLSWRRHLRLRALLDFSCEAGGLAEVHCELSGGNADPSGFGAQPNAAQTVHAHVRLGLLQRPGEGCAISALAYSSNAAALEWLGQRLCCPRAMAISWVARVPLPRPSAPSAAAPRLSYTQGANAATPSIPGIGRRPSRLPLAMKRRLRLTLMGSVA
ncbi:MAG: hypothetical protein JWN85_1054 [Gammaproteobacteria bacterium]|nr:hypothetical protein [Gammaproteobacteria bacterium]